MTDATWDGFVSPNWNEPAGPVGSNWNGGSGNAPDGTAYFPDNNYNRYDILFSQNSTSIQQIVFGSSKPYTFTIQSNQSLNITGNGISTGSSAIPTFTILASGSLNFSGSATAANVIIDDQALTGLSFHNNSTAYMAVITVENDGAAFFFDHATAGAASIVIKYGDVIFSNNSGAATSHISVQTSTPGITTGLSFQQSSSANDAIITVTAGQVSFLDSANAGASTINVQNLTSTVFFFNNSALQNAAITNAGAVIFMDNSTGGNGSINNSGTVAFDGPGGIYHTAHAAGVFSIGSITGDGAILFGNSGVQLNITGSASGLGGALAVDLAAGAAAFIDTISGVISGTGGVTMDAAGTLVLSAANTYTGDTVITNGTVELAAGGSIAGNFDFQNFAPTTTISETLKLDASNQIGGTINNFAQGDVIDITFHSFTAGDHFVWAENASNTGGTLSLLNGAGTVITTLNLGGVHTSAEFTVASDGNGGTLFTDSALAAPPPTSVQQEIIGLYAALYNRAAEGSGYSYWVGVDGQQADAAGVTVATAGSTAVTLADAAVLGQAFVNTQNTFFNQIYAGLSDSAFINALYVNIGSNVGDPTGIAYWAGLLAQAEASGQGVQAARAGLVGQFVHDLIDVNLASGAAALGLTDAQYQAALVRQEAIDNKIMVSEAYLNASQQPNGAILIPQAVGDAAFNAAVSVLQSVTSDPATATAAITGINNAVAHQDLSLI
jgi:autotransporter-associated beta strand protein